VADTVDQPVPSRVAMPWCETCSRFLNPNSLRADGSCPTCGRAVGDPAVVRTVAETEREKAPWHFKLLVLVTVIYLAWRAVEMIGWIA
jgi:predicted RNA-binding Zn-ribbon protein involved in translation (DUF1610 family)